MDYLVIGYEEHTNETFFENIFKLEQSHNLIYKLKTNDFEIKRYYDIPKQKQNTKNTQKAYYKNYYEALESSIALRLRSDVRVGTCLSGGLDSSSIASLASRQYHQKSKENFMAIHTKSTEKASDESDFAKEVAKHCKLDLKIIEPSSEDFISHIDEVIYTQEEPFGSASIFMQYFVMQKAKSQKCTVLLDGQGGDETLLGYERYYPAYLKSLKFIPMCKAFLQSSQNSKLSKKQLFAYMLYFTKAKIRITRLKQKHHFINKSYLNLMNIQYIQESSQNYLDIEKLQYQEIYQTQMPHLLRYEDKNSMRHSIETRLPFIDYQVLETALSLPSTLKIYKGWSKYILRKTVEKILPQNIVWRKNKLGFEAPSKTWLDSISDEMQESIAQSQILSSLLNNRYTFERLNHRQKWKLYNIAKWEEVYHVKIQKIT
jgi:asparagine synthase (glutamine-hydrolysing)